MCFLYILITLLLIEETTYESQTVSMTNINGTLPQKVLNANDKFSE